MKKERNAGKAEKGESEQEELEDKEDVNQDQFFQKALPLPGTEEKKQSPDGKRKHDELEENEELDGIGEDAEDEDIDMAALAEKDPEFHKYLQANDPELLDFNEDDNLEGLEVSEDEDERPSKKRKTGKEVQEVNVQMVKKWKQAMHEQHSIRSLRETVLAFRSAVHMDDTEGKDFKYKIPSSEVYHEVLVTALRDAPKVLSHHLPVKEGKGGKVSVPTNSSQIKKLSQTRRRFERRYGPWSLSSHTSCSSESSSNRSSNLSQASGPTTPLMKPHESQLS